MEFPHFSNSMDGDQDDNGTTERTGLLSSWIANFPLRRSIPAATATVDVNVNVNVNANSGSTSSSGMSILVPENVASYGSINITDGTSLRTVSNGNGSSVGEVRRNSAQGGTNFVDVEDGEGEGENRQRGQQRRRGGTDFATTSIANANSDDAGDGDGDGDANNRERREQQQQQPSGETTDEDSPRDGAIGNLTRRLRCIFSTITFPIVPLGTIVSMALLWVLYAATSLDLRKSCSHPLHSYALVSFLLVAYIPNHSQVRSQIFNYSRERDGPIRPVRVRMYDQFFHTVCLLYVYTGVTLIQTCRDDLMDKSAFDIAASHAHNSYELTMDSEGIGPWNSCEATCPNLYQAMSVYVATLELFTFALILPLLFLPCIYLWFLQRATAEADAFSRLQDRLQEEDALLINGGVTTGEILNSLEIVKIFSSGSSSRKDSCVTDNSNNDNKNDNDNNEEPDESEQQHCWILPLNVAPNAHTGTKCDTKECCICMTAFDVRILPGDEVSSPSSSNPGDAVLQDDHKASDNDSGWKEMDHANCEKDDEGDDVDDDDEGYLQKELESTIVRTRCGHLFHKECLKGWVGGMWSASNNANYRINNQQQEWKKRKARQIHCPLCREDLRPGAVSTSIERTGMEWNGMQWNGMQ
jgi:hypothetical protein